MFNYVHGTCSEFLLECFLAKFHRSTTLTMELSVLQLLYILPRVYFVQFTQCALL